MAMRQLISTLPLLFSLSVSAFVQKHPVIPDDIRLFVSQPLPPGGEDHHTRTTAGRVFGRPLDEKTKELNKKVVTTIKKGIFDNFFAEKTTERAFARFWALEEIARMPYFSYVFALHFYETIGLWRRSDYLRIHFAETWNEQHHLLIMEELGSNRKWLDRFLAQHMAMGYFWLALFLYLMNPTFAYNLNQVVEEEAFATYNRFINENEDFLKTQPAPEIAKEYYMGEDLYLFDSISRNQMSPQTNRPDMETLYDCFCAIREDESEHAKTMIAMQEEGL